MYFGTANAHEIHDKSESDIFMSTKLSVFKKFCR